MIEDFYTRKKASEGTKVPLFYPDGTPSDHWLIVRSVYSDEFRKTETGAFRKMPELAQIEDTDERDRALYELRLETLASLVAGWSFDRELTFESAFEFLKEAPQIADKVDEIAKKKRLFFRKESTPLSSTPEPGSSSASESETASKQRKRTSGKSGNKQAKSPTR